MDEVVGSSLYRAFQWFGHYCTSPCIVFRESESRDFYFLYLL